jgi:hypothetical protein
MTSTPGRSQNSERPGEGPKRRSPRMISAPGTPSESATAMVANELPQVVAAWQGNRD